MLVKRVSQTVCWKEGVVCSQVLVLYCSHFGRGILFKYLWCMLITVNLYIFTSCWNKGWSWVVKLKLGYDQDNNYLYNLVQDCDIGPLHDLVTWYEIRWAGWQMVQRDIKDKEILGIKMLILLFSMSHCTICHPAQQILYYATKSIMPITNIKFH